MNLLVVGFAVYKRLGYADIVSKAAQQSMQAAVEEVQCESNYLSEGEVSFSLVLLTVESVPCSYFSGSSRMPDMTRLLMPTTPQFPAFQEGVYLHHRHSC